MEKIELLKKAIELEKNYLNNGETFAVIREFDQNNNLTCRMDKIHSYKTDISFVKESHRQYLWYGEAQHICKDRNTIFENLQGSANGISIEEITLEELFIALYNKVR